MTPPEPEPNDRDEPPPPSVLEMAVKDFHECFWWWNPAFRPESREDVWEIVRVLRKAGGHRAWKRAQLLRQCL